jgi:hypothetical protein
MAAGLLDGVPIGVVCAAVAAALCTHFATRPETEIDILVG